tara:strand:+ start:153 stop:527 length:375 start_codon:yes stop_codon:yes gene_type:complete
MTENFLVEILKELIATFVCSFIFSILPSLVTGKKIDYKNVLMNTLISSLISVVYKAITYYVFEIDFYVSSFKELLIPPLVFSLVINLADLIKDNKKISLANIVEDLSEKGEQLSFMSFLSEIEM